MIRILRPKKVEVLTMVLDWRQCAVLTKAVSNTESMPPLPEGIKVLPFINTNEK
jgi:hypothetical protein